LHLVIDQPDLLARLESWQPNVWTAIAPEGIAQSTTATAANFALHRKVHLGQLVCLKLYQSLVSVGPFRLIFSLEALG